MKFKKIFALIFVGVLSISTTAAYAKDYPYPIGYYNFAHADRYLTFATDGGSFIKAVKAPTGTEIDVTEYVPTKSGYIFDGWYSDPRTKQNRVKNVALTENIVVYAKWIDDGTPKQCENCVLSRTVTDNSVILETTNGTVEAPVTKLWIEQNARLEYLMSLKLYAP